MLLRTILRCLRVSLGASLLCATAATYAAPPRPNVVIFLADDLGYSDLGCYGSEIATPRLDALAAQGLRFTQFTNTARCWPSRAALLSGYYAQQVNRDPAGVRPRWAALLPDLLRPAGYRSYHSGKWHVDGPVLAAGFVHSYHVADQDRHFGPKSHQLDDRALPQPKPEDHYYGPVAIADHALNWLDEHKKDHAGDPFFLYVAFTTPHFPLQAPLDAVNRLTPKYRKGWDAVRAERWERIRKMGLVKGELPPAERDVWPSWNLEEKELQRRIGSKEVGRAVAWKELTPEQQEFQAQKMAVHAAMIEAIDQQVGRVLDRLKAMGADENTLIFFASDNGASAEQIIRGDGHDPAAPAGSPASYLGLGPGWSTVGNTPFRRHKSWVHQGGVTTPFIVSWPAGIAAKGELRHAPGHLVDVAPTLLELAGLNAPSAWKNEARPPLSGRSLVGQFARDATEPHAPIYYHHEGNRGLRSGDWKLAAAGRGGNWELYNLANDPTESHNLAAEQPERVAQLAAEWARLDAEYARQGATSPSPGPARKKAAAKKAAPALKRDPSR